MIQNLESAARRLLLVAAATVVPVLPTQAQNLPNDAAIRGQCEKAQQILEHPVEPRAQISWASTFILRCGDRAPGAIAASLRRAEEGSSADTLAYNAAFSLADRRLLASIQLLARDLGAAVSRRRDAVALLVHYAAPETVLDARGADEPPGLGLVLAILSHGEPFAGTQPLTSSDRAAAVGTIQLVGTSDPDPKLRRLAKLAAEELKARLGLP